LTGALALVSTAAVHSNEAMRKMVTHNFLLFIAYLAYLGNNFNIIVVLLTISFAASDAILF